MRFAEISPAAVPNAKHIHYFAFDGEKYSVHMGPVAIEQLAQFKRD